MSYRFVADVVKVPTSNGYEDLPALKGEGGQGGSFDATEIKADIESLKSEKANKAEVLTKTSQLENDAGYASIDDASVKTDATWSSQRIANKINDIELAKFPNVTIFGTPTINQGQVSNFSAVNYCQFPFVVDFQNQPFTIDFDITTGNEVTNQHNVLDSVFGLAFAVRSNRFVVAISTNGTNWNIGEGVGTHTVNPNTSYRIKMVWDRTNFVLSYSTDGGASYTSDIVKPLTSQPYPKPIFIGITSDKSTFFNGIINLNYAVLTIANKVVWQGMDDVGLATRMAVNMSNIDEAGVNKIKDIAETYAIKEKISRQSESITEIKDSFAKKTDIPTVPTQVSQLENDAGYLTEHQTLKTINGQSLVGEGNVVVEGGSGGGGITDVQVNGTSVVADGVANIPLATKDAPGVMRTSIAYGNRDIGNGVLAGISRTAEQYKTDSPYLFVSKGTLNNVLAAPSAMPALSAEEQAAAQQRLGILSVEGVTF